MKNYKVAIMKKLATMLLSCLFFAGLLEAAENIRPVGSRAMPLTQQGGTARAMSMGSAAVGLRQGSASLLWNPAGLGVMEPCFEVGLHHNSGLGDAANETAVVGIPAGSLGGFGASFNYVDNGRFEGRDADGNNTSSYSAGNLGGSVGWGKEWLPGISAGVAVKTNRQSLAGKYYSATAADVGLLWTPIELLNVGLTYANLGSRVAGKDLDSGWRAGATYGVRKNILLAASTQLKPNGFDRLELGLEAWVHPSVALRGGYVQHFKDQDLQGLSGLTAGIGVQIHHDLMLDYAYLPFGDLGVSQRVSLTYKFLCGERGASAEKKKEADAIDKLVVLDDTHFERDSATLTADGKAILKDNARILKANPKTKIRIAGYASASGSKEHNQGLSEERARAVKELLVEESGIDRRRLTTVGYGETRPAIFEPLPDDVNSNEAKANMRVLFEIVVK